MNPIEIEDPSIRTGPIWIFYGVPICCLFELFTLLSCRRRRRCCTRLERLKSGGMEGGGEAAMDEETRKRVRETVLEILQSADLEESTELEIRKAASERLGVNLHHPARKAFVRKIVEAFIVKPDFASTAAAAVSEEKPDIQETGNPTSEDKPSNKMKERKKGGGGESDDDSVVCNLSNNRKVSIQEFRGKKLVSIREFYEKDGVRLPSNKGISLTGEQWSILRKATSKIEAAVAAKLN